MNNQKIIIGILIVFVVGLAGVSAYLILNQKNPLTLTVPINNTTANNTTNSQGNSNNPASTNTQNSSSNNQNSVQPTTQSNAPTSGSSSSYDPNTGITLYYNNQGQIIGEDKPLKQYDPNNGGSSAAPDTKINNPAYPYQPT
jgi:hypothetical protein